MLNLNDRKWLAFFISDIFSIESTSSGIDGNKLLNTEGDIPYLTRSDLNNGYKSFVCRQADKYKKDKGNCITIGLDTQTAFYQPHSFYTGQNIQVLQNDKLNAYTAKFFIPLLHNAMVSLNWGGNGATLGRLKRKKIVVPVDCNGVPDYAFMEQYIKEEEFKSKQKYIDFTSTDLRRTVQMPNLNDRKWMAFAVKDIFITEQKKAVQVPTGSYVPKTSLHIGKTPRITVTSLNNGIDGFYSSNDKNYRLFSNFISVSFLGTIFYHPYEASIDMKVHCLQLINGKLNKYISKFLITELKKSISNATYGDQLSSTDLPNKMLMLPVTDDGAPDFDFMEQYIKKQENNLQQRYIEYEKRSAT